MSGMIPITGPLYSTKSEALIAAFDRVRQEQTAAVRRDRAHIMLVGPKGVGKTTALGTAPRPILLHSFDPNGTAGLKDEIEKGGIIVDRRFEIEDLRKPQAFDLWLREFNKLKADGTFEALAEAGGTYCLDSGYLWMESLFAKHKIRFFTFIDDNMTQNVQSKGKDGRQLFGDFLEANLYHTRNLLALPCHMVFTGHVTTYLDEDTGKTITTWVMPGKASESKVPVPFSELWVLATDDKGKRYIATGRDGRFEASTRMGANGKLLLKEEPNISAMLRKCGFNVNEGGMK